MAKIYLDANEVRNGGLLVGDSVLGSTGTEKVTINSGATGIKVNVVQTPWGSYYDRVAAEWAAQGDAFDMVVGDSQWLGLFSAGGGTLNHGGRAMSLAPLSLAWCEQPVAQPLSFAGVGAAWWMSWSE